MIQGYNADAPAQSRRPILEQGGGSNRPDLSHGLESLGRLANQLGQAPLAQNVDPNAGQGVAQGVGNLGQGIEELNQVIHTVKVQEKQFRDYSDVQDAKLHMAMELGEFRKEMMQPGSDPRGWEKGFSGVVQKLESTYFEGKELSNEAKHEIGLNMRSFATHNAVRIGMDAVQATTEKARDSLKVEAMMAVENKDSDKLKAVARWGVDTGLIPEDDGLRLELNGLDQIDAAWNSEKETQKQTALLYNDTDAARNFAKQKVQSPKELQFELAELDVIHSTNAKVKEFEDTLSISPDDAITLAQSKEFSDLRASVKGKMLDMALSVKNEERTAIFHNMKRTIDALGVKGSAGLESRDDWGYLTELQQEELRRYRSEGALNDMGQFSTLLRRIRTYDPKEDGRGFEKGEIEMEIATRFNDEDRVGELTAALAERTDPDAGPVTISDHIFAEQMAEFQQRVEKGLFGDFRIAGNKIKKKKDQDGVEYYGTMDEQSGHNEWGVPVPFTGKRIPFKTKRYRVVELSEKDRDNHDAGKDGKEVFYIDEGARRQVNARRQMIEDEIRKRRDKGELQTHKEMEEALQGYISKYTTAHFREKEAEESEGRAMPESSEFGAAVGSLFPDTDSLLREHHNRYNP